MSLVWESEWHIAPVLRSLIRKTLSSDQDDTFNDLTEVSIDLKDILSCLACLAPSAPSLTRGIGSASVFHFDGMNHVLQKKKGTMGMQEH